MLVSFTEASNFIPNVVESQDNDQAQGLPSFWQEMPHPANAPSLKDRVQIGSQTSEKVHNIRADIFQNEV